MPFVPRRRKSRLYTRNQGTGHPRGDDEMTDEEALALHDCDEMGCATLSHVLYRIHPNE